MDSPKKPLLEIVHVNGRYDANTNQHVSLCTGIGLQRLYRRLNLAANRIINMGGQYYIARTWV